MFDEEATLDFYKVVSIDEIHQVLETLKGDKSPGPDGWTIELFAHFYDIFQDDLHAMVEESRLRGFGHQQNNFYIRFSHS